MDLDAVDLAAVDLDAVDLAAVDLDKGPARVHGVEVQPSRDHLPRRWAVTLGVAGAGVLAAGVWMAGPLPRPELPHERATSADPSFTYPDFPNLPETETRRAAAEATAGTTGSMRSRIATLGVDELLVALAHEQAHANRPRVLRAIDARFRELRGTG